MNKKLICLTAITGLAVVVSIGIYKYKPLKDETVTRNIDLLNSIRKENSAKMNQYIKCFKGVNYKFLSNNRGLISSDKDNIVLAYSMPVDTTDIVQDGVIVNYTTKEISSEDKGLVVIENLFEAENIDLNINTLENTYNKLDEGNKEIIANDDSAFIKISRLNNSINIQAVIVEESGHTNLATSMRENAYNYFIENIYKEIQNISSRNGGSNTATVNDDVDGFNIIKSTKNVLIAYKAESVEKENRNRFRIEVRCKGDKEELSLICDGMLSIINKTFNLNKTFEQLLIDSKSKEELNNYFTEIFREESSNKELIKRVKGLHSKYSNTTAYPYSLDLKKVGEEFRLVFDIEVNIE